MLAERRHDARFRRASKACAASVTALGLVVLAGWLFDLPVLKSVHPNLVTMKPNTAMLFVWLGVGLWPGNEPFRALIRGLAGGAVAAVAGLTLVEYGLGVSLGIDQLLFTER